MDSCGKVNREVIFIRSPIHYHKLFSLIILPCFIGKCQCKDNYVGETCDVKADAVPSYISADNNGLCNTRKTDCSRIVVYADDLIKTDKLTCHLTAVDVRNEHFYFICESSS